MFSLSLLNRLSIGIVLIFGLLHGLMLVLSPVAGAYRGELEQLLADRLGTEVRIGEVRTRWQWLSPALVLDDVDIDDDSGGLSIAQATVGLYLPGLLSDAIGDRLQVGVAGLRLQLTREADGRLHIAGLPAAGDGAAGREQLPRHVTLRDTELVFVDRRAQRPPLNLAPLSLALAHEADELTLRGHLGSELGRIAVAATITGDPTGTDWSGAVRIEARDVAVAQLIKGYTSEYFELEQLTLNGELAGVLEQALPVQITGRMSLNGLRMAALAPDEPAFELPHLNTGLIRFQRVGDHHQLLLEGLEVIGRDGAWPKSDLAVEIDRDDKLQIRADLDFLRLQDLLELLRVRAPWAQFGDAGALAPRGDLRDLRLAIDLGPKDLSWQASCDFDGLSIHRVGESPGVAGLTGRWRGTSSHIQAHLDSGGVRLDFGDTFTTPLELERLAGRFDWIDDGNGHWRLLGDRIELVTAHFSTLSRLRLVNSGDGLPEVDLQTEIGEIDVGNLGHYYPRAQMRDRLEEWLDRGLVEGRIRSGTLLLAGPLDDFPFDRTHNGRLLADLDAEALTVSYHPEWPQLEQVDARIRFQNNALEIRVSEGRLYDSRLRNGTTIRIAQLEPATPVEVRGVLHGPLADDLRVLAESPLKKDFAGFVANLEGSGTASLSLDLAVPIDRLGEYYLNGRLTFEDAGLYLRNWDLPITAIRGPLEFDLEAVRGNGITATALERPVEVTVVPETGGSTRIDVDGHLDIERIQRQLPWLPLDYFASGSSDFVVGIHIPGLGETDAPTMLSVDSELRGVTLKLPEPLSKPSAETSAIRIDVPLDDDTTPLRIRYRGQVDARLANDLGRGEIMLGGGSAGYPDGPQLRVRGRADRLDPNPWVAFFTRLPRQRDAGLAPASLDLDLIVGQFQLGGLSFADTRLLLDELPDRWQGRLQSPTLSGSFRVPLDLDAEPAEFELEYVDLPMRMGDRDDAPQRDDTELDPRLWPAFRLTSRSLRINGTDVGRVEVQATRIDGGLHFSPFNIEGKLHQVFATGDWQMQQQGPRSSFSGRVATDSMATLLERLGFDRQLEGAPANLDFDLSWPGDPSDFSDLRLDGTLGLDIGAGSFLDIEPGVARVAGLLNFNGLFRRLRLDFSDLFSKGYRFDSINGGFTMRNGDAHTEDLLIKGASGLVQIKGRTGLLTRDFDQRVTVTPRFDATLPIAGTLAAGPIGGAVALVAQQLLRDQVDEINRFRYQVTGPWDKPEVVQLDSSGTLSKLLKPLSPGEQPAASPDAAGTAATDGGASVDEAPSAEDVTNAADSTATAGDDTLFDRLWEQLKRPREIPDDDGGIFEQ